MTARSASSAGAWAASTRANRQSRSGRLLTSPRKRGEGEVPVYACRLALLLPLKTRYAFRMAHPLARIIEQLKREPSRTGSIVITVFGDAIVPRGGSVWLGTLLEFFKALDIDSGVVRTAMSRLAGGAPAAGDQGRRQHFFLAGKKGRGNPDRPTQPIFYLPPPGRDRPVSMVC